MFFKQACCCQQQLQQAQKHPVFVLARPAWPKELGHWFCIQNLWLSSGIAFGSNGQMTYRLLVSNLNSAPYQWVVKVFKLSALKTQNHQWGVWIFFGSVENAKIEDSSESVTTWSTRMCYLQVSSSEFNLWNLLQCFAMVVFTAFEEFGIFYMKMKLNWKVLDKLRQRGS